jgi:tetratricopeptide (TPR) repeat protein
MRGGGSGEKTIPPLWSGTKAGSSGPPEEGSPPLVVVTAFAGAEVCRVTALLRLAFGARLYGRFGSFGKFGAVRQAVGARNAARTIVVQIGAAIGREFSYALLAAVTRKSQAELRSGLDRLVAAGLLFQQGEQPHASYLFKHALIQDAAYSTLLRDARRALHACIAEALEGQFPEIADNQPALLARHCTEAGLIEKAAGLWGKAGQRSMGRSALVEGFAQLSRALSLIATLPATPALRRQEIKLQVALITPLMHIKGHAAPETKSATDRARLLIEQAENLGEVMEDPLLLLWVLHAAWLAKYVAFDGEVCCDLAEQVLALAKRKTASGPLLAGHRAVGTSLLHVGKLAEARVHLDRAIQLYTPAEDRSVSRHRLVTRYDVEAFVALSYRAMDLWLLGYPEAALLDVDRALKIAAAHSPTAIPAENQAPKIALRWSPRRCWKARQKSSCPKRLNARRPATSRCSSSCSIASCRGSG